MPKFRFRNILLASALLGVAALNANATNLVLDGNFASDAVGGQIFNGPLSAGSPWTVSSTGNAGNGVLVVLPGCCGGLGPVDPLTVGSPDLGAPQVVYFVSNVGTNTLSQTLSGFISGDTYEVSFDAYFAFTGRNNPQTPSFNATLGGDQIANFALTSLPIPSSPTDASAWTHFSETFTASSSGSLNLDFNFVAPGGDASDILLDRVYVGLPVTNVTPTPEPGALILTGSGVLSSLLMFRRRIRYAGRA